MKVRREPFTPLHNLSTPTNQWHGRTPKSRTTEVFQSATGTNVKTPKTRETTPVKRPRDEETETVQKVARAKGVVSEVAFATPSIRSPKVSRVLVIEEESYEGDLVDGLRDGEGTLLFPNGDRYVGSFRRGKQHGMGTYVYAKKEEHFNANEEMSGCVYFGVFENGESQGKGQLVRPNGDVLDLIHENKRGDRILSINYANGNVLEVTYKDDIGYGTLTYKNGDTYVGEFSFEMPQGIGTMTYKEGDKSKYVGPFFQGKAQGKEGILHYKNGDKYVGDFFRDQAQGRGTFIYANGDNYIGQFNEGKFEGPGIFTYANGCFYEGMLRDGVPDGHGILDLRSQNDKEPIANCSFLRWEAGNYSIGNTYIGKFRKGRFEGEGVIHYANRDKYVGECLHNLPHGKGTLFLFNGSKYEGQFARGEKHGHGKMTYTDGRRPVIGNFIHNLFDVSSSGQDWEVHKDSSSE